MLPCAGVKVRLLRGSLKTTGVLAWQVNGQGGLNFDRPIDVTLWVKRVAHAGQQRVDGMVEAIRGNEEIPRDFQEVPVTEELSAISAALDEVCERLSGTENMSAELADDLLKLDAISQSLRNAARRRNA